ncbi:hypothetical protein [Halorientalis salina]|uniref:hypothetical protein n=1 Tax=Halorientalis salina TaxID=2932266 RepID=UPI0010AB5CD1|nr:hypothetical protein [Halorientalis salina]
MEKDVSRRQTLRLGAAAAGLGAVGSLSGCSQIKSAVPFIGGASYKQWLPAPDELGDSDHYYFSYTNYKQIRNNEDNFDEEAFENYEAEAETDLLDLDIDDIDEVVSLGFGSASVLIGSFNKEDVTDELEDNDFDDEDDQGNFTIYEPENGSGAVAVKGGTAVYADDSDAVETIIDTKNGDEDRYVGENEEFKELVNKIGNGTRVSGRTQEEVDETDEDYGQFEGAVASGGTDTVNGETTKIKSVTLFDDADDVPQDEFEDYIDDSDYWDELDNVSVSKNGRAVVVTGQMDTDEYNTN